jgi:energy-converting hydrogenase Eha subunit B
MRKPKYYLSLSSAERNLFLIALVAFRNKLCAQGGYADAVDEVILKLTKVYD